MGLFRTPSRFLAIRSKSMHMLRPVCWLGQYAYYPGSKHTAQPPCQYADCPGSKHTAQALGQYTDCPISGQSVDYPRATPKYIMSRSSAKYKKRFVELSPPHMVTHCMYIAMVKMYIARCMYIVMVNGSRSTGHEEIQKKQHLYRIKCDSRPITLTHVSYCVTLGVFAVPSAS